MKKIKRLVPPALFLIPLVLMSTACGASGVRSANPETTQLPQASRLTALTPVAIDLQATETAAIPTIAVVATSRGPNLEATDPATVRLDSGSLQLVEFFRFT